MGWPRPGRELPDGAAGRCLILSLCVRVTVDWPLFCAAWRREEAAIFEQESNKTRCRAAQRHRKAASSTGGESRPPALPPGEVVKKANSSQTGNDSIGNKKSANQGSGTSVDRMIRQQGKCIAGRRGGQGGQGRSCRLRVVLGARACMVDGAGIADRGNDVVE